MFEAWKDRKRSRSLSKSPMPATAPSTPGAFATPLAGASKPIASISSAGEYFSNGGTFLDSDKRGGVRRCEDGFCAGLPEEEASRCDVDAGVPASALTESNVANLQSRLGTPKFAQKPHDDDRSSISSTEASASPCSAASLPPRSPLCDACPLPQALEWIHRPPSRPSSTMRERPVVAEAPQAAPAAAPGPHHKGSFAAPPGALSSAFTDGLLQVELIRMREDMMKMQASPIDVQGATRPDRPDGWECPRLCFADANDGAPDGGHEGCVDDPHPHPQGGTVHWQGQEQEQGQVKAQQPPAGIEASRRRRRWYGRLLPARATWVCLPACLPAGRTGR